MNIVILVPWNLGFLEQNFPGVHNKVVSQCKTFQSVGFSCRIVSSRQVVGSLRKLQLRLPFASDGIEWEDHIDSHNCDCLYIRRPDYISFDMVRALELAKRENPNIRILLEIPTYPYEREYANIRKFPMLLKDLLHRGKLRNCVDRIVDFSGEKAIFNIPTLQMTNGVDLSQLSLRSLSSAESEELNVICVAAFAKWHGIDRFLSGMEEYVRKGSIRRVRLHLLGEGPALDALKKQVENRALQKHVVFYGQCNRRRMDEVYDKCQFAIECLGCHRKGIDRSSSLKSREYLAKGMPFVYSGEIDVFLEDPVDFCLKVPADESPVDIEELVAFADGLYERESEEALIGRIRKYAEGHVGMNVAMKSVIDYVKENCHDGQ